MRSILLAMALLSASGCVSSRSVGPCFNPTIPAGETTVARSLPTQIKDPYVYYRSMSFNHAIVIPIATTLEALRVRSNAGNQDAATLLSRLMEEQPLTRNLDLFRFVLEEPSQFSFVQRLLVDELEAGNAAVYDAAAGSFLPAIQLKRGNGGSSAQRDFSADGERILWSLDCIVD